MRLISFQLQSGSVPYFVRSYMLQSVASPAGGERLCYLGVSRGGDDEYLPETVELLSESEFVSRYATALIMEEDSMGGPPVLMTETEKRAVALGFLHDNVGYVRDDELAQIDRQTGRAISRSVHELSGVEEQIGECRNAIVCLFNELGISPPASFARFNEIAVAEIEKAQAKKVVL